MVHKWAKSVEDYFLVHRRPVPIHKVAGSRRLQIR